jgi:hypothetical protein
MIYCGSGSDFEKVSVPVPVPVPDPDNTKLNFSTKINFLQNLAFSISKAALFPRKLASHLKFFDFSFYFILNQDKIAGSGNGTVMHSGSVSAKAKS